MRLLPSFFAAGALAGALAAACILVVPPRDVGLACTYAGADTACGRCVASACANAVNACCGDSVCAENGMPALDSCASGRGCAALLVGTPSATNLASCVRASCSDPCSRGADGGPSPDTIPACVKFGADGCRCDAVSAFADGGVEAGDDSGATPTKSCTAADFGISAGACCGFKGWPDGGACVCAPVRCLELRSNPKSCVCGLYSVSADFIEKYSCYQGAPCCKKPGACACNETPCKPDEVQVSDCTPQDVAQSIQCDNGVRVPRCQ